MKLIEDTLNTTAAMVIPEDPNANIAQAEVSRFCNTTSAMVIPEDPNANVAQAELSRFCSCPEEAVQDILDDADLLIGGFALSGVPENLIQALVKKRPKGLVVVSGDVGVDGYGVGQLLAGQVPMVKRFITTYVGENKEFQRQYLGGRLEVELTPQVINYVNYDLSTWIITLIMTFINMEMPVLLASFIQVKQS